MIKSRYGRWHSVLIALVAIVAMPQMSALAQGPVVGRTPFGNIIDGPAEYRSACAICHGTTGQGNGPSASTLKTPSTNLALLAKNNGGTFPADKVYQSIMGPTLPHAHGTLQKPVWGRSLLLHSKGLSEYRGPALSDDEMRARLKPLVDYIATLQTND